MDGCGGSAHQVEVFIVVNDVPSENTVTDFVVLNHDTETVKLADEAVDVVELIATPEEIVELAETRAGSLVAADVAIDVCGTTDHQLEMLYVVPLMLPWYTFTSVVVVVIQTVTKLGFAGV